jgi:DNA replication protein DnaC
MDTELLKNTLTDLSARETKEQQLYIKELKVWADWFQFNTCGDPQLTEMLHAASRFALAIKKKCEPRWLCLLGKSGLGKTHLARDRKSVV